MLLYVMYAELLFESNATSPTVLATGLNVSSIFLFSISHLTNPHNVAPGFAGACLLKLKAFQQRLIRQDSAEVISVIQNNLWSFCTLASW